MNSDKQYPKIPKAARELSAKEEIDLLRKHHPSHQHNLMAEITHGPNKGEQAPKEVLELINGQSHITKEEAENLQPRSQIDVLVIGGGGAGLIAARAAKKEGASVLLATKLRIGDSNTCMANGISAAINNRDSAALHFLDTFIGGHHQGDPKLIKTLVENPNNSIDYLKDIGIPVKWSHDTPHISKNKFGGHSIERGVKALFGATGLEIVRALKREIKELKIMTLEFHPIIEFLKNSDGDCSGAILMNLDTYKPIAIHAKSVILATGGLGQLKCGKTLTSNHYGATGDGLAVAYRLGARLTEITSLQFHPTGMAWPESCEGILISEHFRQLGATLLNSKGERFINETACRDIISAAIFREFSEGRAAITPSGLRSVWLDATSLIKHTNNLKSETIMKTHKNLLKKGLDIFRERCQVCPSLHYQNGGLKIKSDCQTTISGLFAAGEVTGGIHGTNRLGGNSLLELIVFGNKAGINAAKYARTAKKCPHTFDHINKKEEGRNTVNKSPQLFPTLKSQPMLS